jgi:hypothetical protein
MDTAARQKLIWVVIAVVVVAAAIGGYFAFKSEDGKSAEQDQLLRSQCQDALRSKTGEAPLVDGWERDGSTLTGYVYLSSDRTPFTCTGTSVTLG